MSCVCCGRSLEDWRGTARRKKARASGGSGGASRKRASEKRDRDQVLR